MARQQQIDVGVCSHTIVEAVENLGGTIIARRCRTCTKIVAHVGQCNGCKTIGNLTHFLSKLRFCSERCMKALRQRVAKERAAKRAEANGKGKRK